MKIANTEFTEADIILINKELNEDLDGWWCKEQLFESCFSSYYYYETELEQACSVDRGLCKNHAFSNANKHTASTFLITILKDMNYYISDNDIINLTLDVSTHNYEVSEIADKLKLLLHK